MAQNDFATFAGDPAANVMTQAQYADPGFTARLLGFSAGTALSLELNKVWRQASLIAAMIGQFTVDHSGQNMLDDGTPAGMTALETNFTTAVHNVAVGAVGVGYLPLIGGSLSGDLTINSDNLNLTGVPGQNPVFAISRRAGQFANVTGLTGTLLRWAITPGNSDPEQGSNTGSNFAISRYADAANTLLDSPLTINRATGVVNFTRTPTVNGASLPYVRLAGDVMTGTLGVGGTGISYNGLGGFWASHHFAFGWDGTFVQMAVDGTNVGQIANTAWVQSLTGAYLPLAGGTLSGVLTVNAATTVGGTLTARSTVIFGNLGDFSNFTDGAAPVRYRYRQWAGSWYDYWDGTSGARSYAGVVSGNAQVLMTLDGGGTLTVYNQIHANGMRLVVNNSLNTSISPSVCAWNQAQNSTAPNGNAKGFWTDSGSLNFGNMDGGGNPLRADMSFDNGGYGTIYNSFQVNGSFTCYSGATVQKDLSVGGNLGVNGYCGLNGGATVAGTLQVNTNINCNNSINGATVSSNGYLWANDRLVVKSGYAAVVSWNTAAGVAGVRHIDGGGFNWAYCSGTGDNPQAPSMNLSIGGRLSCSGGVNVSDARVKHDIRLSPAFDSLGAIRALASKAFNWNVDNRYQPFGFIASEMRERLPDVVETIAGMGGLEGIDVLALLTHAIRAIQQLADRIEEARA